MMSAAGLVTFMMSCLRGLSRPMLAVPGRAEQHRAGVGREPGDHLLEDRRDLGLPDARQTATAIVSRAH